MLETLDSIEWAKLTHAAGSAADVPDMIRQLLSNKASVRERALDERGLWGTLCHQDSVYEATAPAVPFLLELVRAPGVRDRGKILDLLADFAQGGYEDVDDEEAKLLRAAATLAPQEREQRARMIDWTRQTHAAVRAGRDIYLSLLADRVRRVRQAALGVLEAACRTEGEVVVPVICARVSQERDRVQRAALVLALSRFVPVTRETRTFLTQTHTHEPDALARLAAAIALAEVDAEQAPPGLDDYLARALVRPDRDIQQACVDLLGNYQTALVDALRGMGARGVTTALREIARELREQCQTPMEQLLPGREGVIDTWRPGPDGRAMFITLQGRSLYPPPPILTLTRSLLRLTFGNSRFGELTAASLSASQRQALALLHACDAAWHYDLDLQEQLFEYGVPHTRDGLRNYLGDATSGEPLTPPSSPR